MNRKFIILVCFSLFGSLVCCVSPRRTCEWVEDPVGKMSLCMMLSAVVITCPHRITEGKRTETECQSMTDFALLYCVAALSSEEKCKKESDLPLIPKIVLNRSMPLKLSQFSKTNYSQTAMLANKSCIANDYNYIK